MRVDSISVTPLVGRAEELATLSGWLDEEVRQIALHGPPGVGKTALARAFGALTERRVFRVDAPGLVGVEDVESALADALGLANPAAISQSLLAQSPCIVVLDGVDRVDADALREWLAPLVEVGPECAIVVTSRRHFDDWEGEVLDVEPLRVPADVDDLEAPAMVLWFQRIRDVRGAYAPAKGELEEVVGMLRAIDGLPLSVELAAARAATFGTHALVRSFAREPGTAPLTAVLEDAVAPLSEELRAALWRLSIFRGGFDAPAAGAVLALDDGDAFDQLVALRRASLLAAAPSERGPSGDLLLRLLGNIRDFARAHLDAAGETDATIARHAAHFAERARRSLDDPDAELGEPDELAAAIDRALESGDPTLLTHATEIAIGAEHRTWASTTWLRQRLPDLVDAATDAALDEGLLAAAELALARLRVRTGPMDEAEQRCAHALSIYERRGDDAGVARTQRTRALIASQLGRRAEAEEAAHEAVRRAKGDRSLEGLALHTVARIALRGGDHVAAVRAYEDALDRHRRAGVTRWEALALAELAIVHVDRGEVDAAEARVEAGLAIEVSDRMVEALFVGAQSNIAHERGDLDAAVDGYERASDLADRHGNARYAGLCRGYRGVALLERGQLGSAQVILEDAAAVMRLVGDAGHDRLFRAHSMVARMRQGATVPELEDVLEIPDDAEPWLSGALRALRRALGLDDDDSEPSALMDARLAERVARGLAQIEPAAEPDLVIAPTWFSTPHGGKVDTRRRAAARRMLEALVDNHAAPGAEPLDADALIAAGWPGERILPTAARNRLHVTLHRLRDLGLREGLTFADDGWALDPKLTIERVEE